MRKLLIWVGGLLVCAAAVLFFLNVLSRNMLMSAFPLPASPGYTSGDVRTVTLPVSETFRAGGGVEPAMKIPGNIIRWIIEDTVYVNFVYSDLEKWVAEGFVANPVLHLGNNNLDDLTVEVTHFSRKNPLKEDIDKAVNSDEKTFIPSSETEKNAGLERFYIGRWGNSTHASKGYYWISNLTKTDGTYIETLLDDGQRAYINLYSQHGGVYLKTTFPEKMIGDWKKIRDNVHALVGKWQNLPVKCGDK